MSEDELKKQKMGTCNNLQIQEKNATFHEKVKKWHKYITPTYIIFLILKNTINGPMLSCTYLKTIIGYLQLKSSTNLVWNYCSIQLVFPWNVQYIWIMSALGESENKSIARFNKHTCKHRLKHTFCCHRTFSECLKLNMSAILWINQSYLQFHYVKFDTLCSVEPINPKTGTVQHRWRSILMVWNFNWNLKLSLGKVWYHKSYAVEARGSLEKLSEKAHVWI